MHRRSRLKPLRICIRKVSQEPRRPRFSFFYLHNVKELTSGPGAGRRRWKQSFRILANRAFVRFPGTRPCPFRIADQWERVSLGVVSVAGFKPDISVCQHPIFNFRNFRNSKLEIANCLVFSRVCFSLWHLAAPRSSAMGGLYGRPPNLSTGQNDKSVIFCVVECEVPFVHRSPTYSTRAKGCHGLLQAVSEFAIPAFLPGCWPCGKLLGWRDPLVFCSRAESSSEPGECSTAGSWSASSSTGLLFLSGRVRTSVRSAESTARADMTPGGRQMPANGRGGSVLPHCRGKWPLAQVLTRVSLRGMAGYRCRKRHR